MGPPCLDADYQGHEWGCRRPVQRRRQRNSLHRIGGNGRWVQVRRASWCGWRRRRHVWRRNVPWRGWRWHDVRQSEWTRRSHGTRWPDAGEPGGGGSTGAASPSSGGGSSSMSPYASMGGGDVDPAGGRYVDDKNEPLAGDRLRTAIKSDQPADAFLAVAKRMPMRMRVRMNVLKLPLLLCEFSQSNLPVEVRQVRINTSAGGGMTGSSGTRGFGGGPPTMSGAGHAGCGGQRPTRRQWAAWRPVAWRAVRHDVRRHDVRRYDVRRYGVRRYGVWRYGVSGHGWLERWSGFRAEHRITLRCHGGDLRDHLHLQSGRSCQIRDPTGRQSRRGG